MEMTGEGHRSSPAFSQIGPLLSRLGALSGPGWCAPPQTRQVRGSSGEARGDGFRDASDDYQRLVSDFMALLHNY
jgi:hypothetical protein